jgi:hypothetical protein
MVRVESKHELFNLYEEEKSNIQKVEETSYCTDFQIFKKGTWVYKRQVE